MLGVGLLDGVKGNMFESFVFMLDFELLFRHLFCYKLEIWYGTNPDEDL